MVTVSISVKVRAAEGLRSSEKLGMVSRQKLDGEMWNEDAELFECESGCG